MTPPTRPVELMLAPGQKPVNEAGKLVVVKQRCLYEVYEQRGGVDWERVGVHEDEAVATDECARLDREAAGPTADGSRSHVVREHWVFATNDELDGMPNLQGPVVSDGEVTMKNLKRAERPDTVIAEP